ncbi:hypothetical protein GCM10010389_00100 [Streptomyces echinoruber]|uniref:Uncharacterized protein n=1 Tax=Streptomyces echinoruber TaxID=68898 RepID=A0A918V444_9ACTN|nr:hypothetical protein GCM10010389_00100 [Streptomyces echinoruber]
MVLWRRFVARGLPVTQASGHAGREVRGDSPDSLKVWHGVSTDKALRARNCSQMKSLLNK